MYCINQKLDWLIFEGLKVSQPTYERNKDKKGLLLHFLDNSNPIENSFFFIIIIIIE